jgi:hypothetical protein
MKNRIILPPNGLLTPGGPPSMDLDREPIVHRCPMCKRQSAIIVPKGAGKMVWRCPCGMNRNLDWGKAPALDVGGAGALRLQRRPLRHECQDCGLNDWIVLPPGGGDIRWECKCGSVWLIRFTPERWMLARVKAGEKKVEPPPTEKENG